MLDSLHNGLPCSTKRMKIEKIEKLFSNLHDKNEYLMHIRNIKQALNHGLVFKTVHWDIKLHQKAWLKSYVDIKRLI